MFCWLFRLISCLTFFGYLSLKNHIFVHICVIFFLQILEKLDNKTITLFSDFVNIIHLNIEISECNLFNIFMMVWFSTRGCNDSCSRMFEASNAASVLQNYSNITSGWGGEVGGGGGDGGGRGWGSSPAAEQKVWLCKHTPVSEPLPVSKLRLLPRVLTCWFGDGGRGAARSAEHTHNKEPRASINQCGSLSRSGH